MRISWTASDTHKLFEFRRLSLTPIPRIAKRIGKGSQEESPQEAVFLCIFFAREACIRQLKTIYDFSCGQLARQQAIKAAKRLTTINRIQSRANHGEISGA